MPKNYTPIIIVLTILVLVTMIGYIMPEKKDPIPKRIFFENIGGRVVFDHATHLEKYEVACEDCHHESTEPREKVQRCRDCHGIDFENPIFKTTHSTTFNDPKACITCHHLELESSKWNHKEHSLIYGMSCRDCHHKNFSVEPKKQNCANCHQPTSSKFIPNIEEATHIKCALCHREKFEFDGGCIYCHAPVYTAEILKKTGNITLSSDYDNCSICHVEKKPQTLVIGRMDAFHKQCIGCHEKLQKGPFKKDQCNQCHTK